jgi:iron-sulfur cluster assembly accessory protein
MEALEQTDQITLTTPAAEAVRELLEQRSLPGYALRVFVSGSGCSGYQYGMGLDNNIRDEDTVYEQNGIKVVVDDVSINYLRGATIDYVNEDTGSGFRIDNPNAMSGCNCGDSDAEGGGCSSCQ